jgi:hypothetical protein
MSEEKTKKKRQPNLWNEALKEYNRKSKKGWCIPRKDTKEYMKVRSIYERMKKKTSKSKKEN